MDCSLESFASPSFDEFAFSESNSRKEAPVTLARRMASCLWRPNQRNPQLEGVSFAALRLRLSIGFALYKGVCLARH